MFNDEPGKKMQIPVFWHSVCNFIPSVHSAGIIRLFEQKKKGKKLSFTYLRNFLERIHVAIRFLGQTQKDCYCHSIPAIFSII